MLLAWFGAEEGCSALSWKSTSFRVGWKAEPRNSDFIGRGLQGRRSSLQRSGPFPRRTVWLVQAVGGVWFWPASHPRSETVRGPWTPWNAAESKETSKEPAFGQVRGSTQLRECFQLVLTCALYFLLQNLMSHTCYSTWEAVLSSGSHFYLRLRVIKFFTSICQSLDSDFCDPSNSKFWLSWFGLLNCLISTFDFWLGLVILRLKNLSDSFNWYLWLASQICDF